MQQQQTKNIVIFVVVMTAWVAIWYSAKNWLYPPPPSPAPPEARLAAALLSNSDGGLGQGLAQAGALWSVEAKRTPETKPEEKPDAAAPPPPVFVEKPPPAPDQLKTLGDSSRTSKFHIQAVLTPRGGGVLSVILNKFQQADALGRPVTLPDGSPEPLHLVPEDPDQPVLPTA